MGIFLVLGIKNHHENRNEKRQREEVEGPKMIAIKKKKTYEKRPPHSSRYDGLNHKLQHQPPRQRCKMKNCKAKSMYICIKCNVHLCTNGKTEKNCFEKFHCLNNN